MRLPLRNQSIRRRFVLILGAFSFLIAGLFGFMAWRVAGTALEAELDRRVVQVAGAFARTRAQSDLLLALQPGDEESLAFTGYQAQLDTLSRHYIEEAWIFTASDRRALVTSRPSDSIRIGDPLRFLEPWDPEIRVALRDGSSSTPLFEAQDRAFKYGFVGIGGGAVLGVLMPVDLYEPLARLRAALLVGSLVALLLAFGIGSFLATTVALPLERLGRAAGRIQRGYLDRPVRLDREDELGRLAEAMERMRQGILERDEQLKLMLAQVAHEIRNPLGGLDLFASAAAETEDPQERHRLMARVRSEVAALSGIIQDFLTFARPAHVETRPVDLAPSIHEATELTRAELENRGGVMEVDLADSTLPALADANHAKRVLLNLLGNASAVSDRVLLRAWSERGEVVVAVIDDGPGVPEDERDRIFDPFVTDKQQGAGLGLAIVRKTMEQMGGRVSVADARASGAGEGAEFRVYFQGLEDLPSF
jgi:signal transduction histidine kinase